jgi:hypothetical protein
MYDVRKNSVRLYEFTKMVTHKGLYMIEDNERIIGAGLVVNRTYNATEYVEAAQIKNLIQRHVALLFDPYAWTKYLDVYSTTERVKNILRISNGTTVKHLLIRD